jgi:hypothetical protein
LTEEPEGIETCQDRRILEILAAWPITSNRIKQRLRFHPSRHPRSASLPIGDERVARAT